MSLRGIYDSLVSINAQLNDIHDQFLDLNWVDKGGGSYLTTVTDEWLPNWALKSSDNIQTLVESLTMKMWELPEVNGNDPKELQIKKERQKLAQLEEHGWENNDEVPS